MQPINYESIVKEAWTAYDGGVRSIRKVRDISAQVSTNHVYKISFQDKSFVIAKLSFFGKYEHFVEDHSIINVLVNNLPYPYEHLLARSLMKGNTLYTYNTQTPNGPIWVVFYNPVKIQHKLARKLNSDQIVSLGKEFAKFHQACAMVTPTLPISSKSLEWDIQDLDLSIRTDNYYQVPEAHIKLVRNQCELFIHHSHMLGAKQFLKMPVFVDWNIGNFSVRKNLKLYSRWDYDWFRMSSRMLDFYFFSRLVSEIGDRTVFSYNIGPLMEDRFMLFLKAYHSIYPLTRSEIYFLKEVYRFFLLNYVIKYGTHFFRSSYAIKLQQEAYEIHFPSIREGFKVDKILAALSL